MQIFSGQVLIGCSILFQNFIDFWMKVQDDFPVNEQQEHSEIVQVDVDLHTVFHSTKLESSERMDELCIPEVYKIRLIILKQSVDF